MIKEFKYENMNSGSYQMQMLEELDYSNSEDADDYLYEFDEEGNLMKKQ